MRPTARLARPARLAAGGLVAVALLGVSACNGDNADARAQTGASVSAPSTPATSEAPAVSSSPPSPTPKTKAPKTVKVSHLSAKTLVPALQKALATHKSAHMRMQISSKGLSMTADGHASYGPHPAMRMTMHVPQLGTGDIELRFMGDTAYIAIPPMTPPGKFVKFDASDPNNPLGPDLGQIRGQLSPSRTFDGFEAGLKSVDFIGVESVDGEPMGHYLLTLDSAKALKATTGQKQPPGTPKTVSYDLWVDRHNLMRRLQMNISGTGIDISADDWGKPVHVQAPPAKDVVSLSSLSGTKG
ncbi:MAG TPA: LppX_LprAFG lipoprotein [Nocardioidaceae bacterium]|nr:LppX_LprAFG lipoprotein [Nocardioidaceae bacterium]